MVESKEFPGFCEIPGYKNYVISQAGTVISRHSSTLMEGSTNPAGYVNFRLTGDNGHVHTWGRHRLMCYVFKPQPDISELDVNHINGIKGDDFLDNLEWVTRQGNVEHAGEHGLTSKCSPIEARCVDTGTVEQFPSYRACAKAYGLSKDAVAWRINHGEDRVYPERKQYRLKRDVPWVIPTDIEQSIADWGFTNAVAVRHLLTGEEHTFNSQVDLARHLGIAGATISQWLDRPNQPVLPGCIQVKRQNGEGWRPVSDPYLELASTGLRPVVAINPEGVVKVFESLVSCASELFLKTTTLHQRLKCSGKSYNGFRFYYYTEFVQISPTVQQCAA